MDRSQFATGSSTELLDVCRSFRHCDANDAVKHPTVEQRVAAAVVVLRGHKVLLDSGLAALYEVSTKRFNEQVRRNRERFPEDFMFQLTAEEVTLLRSQIATLEAGRGRHRKYRPYAFTEHGAIMAASVLNSSRAVEISVYIVRAFVQLRAAINSNRELMHPPAPERRPIGITADINEKSTDQ